jgi:acetoin utilization deacetylase AcuC-like enzyme
LKIFHFDQFHFHLPPGHRFPLHKYRLLRERVQDELVPPGELLVPEPACDADLLLAHTPDYLARLAGGRLSEGEIRRLGLPWSPELLERARRSVGGTIAACRAALAEGIAVSLGGGTHHACADHGQGFCVFNDVPVALRLMQRERRIRIAVVLDCDVHQGNGTADILAGDASIFTFSIHAQNNFPFRKIPGDLDLPLADGTGDAEYLALLEEGARRAIAFSSPDLAVYLAGADVFAGDRLGRLSLTFDGLAARDTLIFGLCRAAGVPVAVVMSGGYGREIADTVAIHARTVRAALDFWGSGSL